MLKCPEWQSPSWKTNSSQGAPSWCIRRSHCTELYLCFHISSGSDRDGGTVSDSPSHFCERRGASEMHSTLLATRLHAHIPVCAFPVLLEASAHSVPGLFSPEPWMKYARTQAEHRRAGIQRQKLKEKSEAGYWSIRGRRTKERFGMVWKREDKPGDGSDTWEKWNEEKGVCKSDKEELGDKHMETRRRNHEKERWIGMKNSKRHSWEKQKRAKGLFQYLLGIILKLEILKIKLSKQYI